MVPTEFHGDVHFKAVACSRVTVFKEEQLLCFAEWISRRSQQLDVHREFFKEVREGTCILDLGCGEGKCAIEISSLHLSAEIPGVDVIDPKSVPAIVQYKYYVGLLLKRTNLIAFVFWNLYGWRVYGTGIKRND